MKGVISAGNEYTAQAGAQMLIRGGNAIDAAVSAAFASFVAESVMVNIGGGGIATLFLAQSAQVFCYDFFSAIPGGKYQAEISDFKRILVDYGVTQQPFYIGRASSAVPGVVAGLCTLAEEYGSLPLADLLQPAINFAKQGVILSDALDFATVLLTDILTDTPGSAAIFAPQGSLVKSGQRLTNAPLANSLELLAKQGKSLFYTGAIARKIVADQQAHGGLITQADLADYQVYQLDPIAIPYRNHTILLPPPASVGGALIAFSLRLLGAIDFSLVSYESSERLRILAEVMRLTNIARAGLKPNPSSVAQFLSEGHINKYQNRLLAILAGEAPPAEPKLAKGPNDTTHISVMDGRGNVVSLTTSAGESAGYAVADTGLLMNNMLGEIDLHPNGFHTAPPGTRLQTMMSPTLILANGKPRYVLGSGGSTRLRSAILQVISNLLDYNMPLAQAVEAPRIHFEDGKLQFEGGNSISARAGLIKGGYWVTPWPDKNMYFGGVHSVGFEGDKLTGAGDSRRGGHTIVVG